MHIAGEKEMKLNLGCGNIRKEGWVNCDFVRTSATDKVFDMTKFPYPFRSNSIDEIEMIEVIEHLPDTIATLRECHRILKIGGRIHLTTPYYLSYHAWANPDHKRAFNYMSFFHLKNNSGEHKVQDFGYGFRKVNVRYSFGFGRMMLCPISNLFKSWIDKSFLRFIICPEGLDVELIK